MDAAVDTLKERILSLVREYGGSATFAELTQGLGQDVSGELTMEITTEDRGALVVWAGVSEPFARAVGQLTDPGGPLKYEPVPLLVYAYDGAVLRMPVAKRVPLGGYKEPHWLPVALTWRDPR
jgi:hypothetical protein